MRSTKWHVDHVGNGIGDAYVPCSVQWTRMYENSFADVIIPHFFVIRFVLVHIPARTYFFILVSGTPLAHQFVSSYQCDTSAHVLSGPRIMADPFNLNVWSPRSSPHPPRSITVVACTFNLSHQWCYILFRIRFLLVLTRSALWSVRHFK